MKGVDPKAFFTISKNILSPPTNYPATLVLVSDNGRMSWAVYTIPPLPSFTYEGFPGNAQAAGYSDKFVVVTGTPIGASSQSVIMLVPSAP